MAKSKVKNIFQDYEPLWKYIRGEAKWAYVLEPDDYGNWSVNIYSDEIEELIPELKEMLDKAVEHVENEGKEIKVISDEFTKVDKEGNTFMKFTRKKYDDDTPPVKLYNVRGQEVTGEWTEPIGGGSKVRVKVMFKPFYIPATKSVGISKKLLALQIIENKKFSDDGFTNESSDDDAPFESEEY